MDGGERGWDEADREDDGPAAARLVRVIGAVWLGYLAALLAADRLAVAARAIGPALPPRYYATQALAALPPLALAWWPAARRRLGRAWLPLVIGWMLALPTLATRLLANALPPGPMTSAEGLLLRSLPVLLMALLLVAWRYRWRQVWLFSLAAALAAVAPSLGAGPWAPFDPLLLAALIQTMSLLTVGYGMCAVMARLRAQRLALEQANRQVRRYAGTLEQFAMSRERNRVARELHDTLAHTLSGLAVQLEATKVAAARDPAATQGMLDIALGATRSGLQETRRTLGALRASPLDELGLVPALRQLAEEAARRAKLRLDCSLPSDLPALAPDVEHAVYRIAQEAVANAAYHANAGMLALALGCDGGRLTLRVADDGAGFDARQQPRAGHYGLAGMRERAMIVGGRLDVASQAGRGTAVTFHIAC